jgi:tetratricopeptide (TPR) repeat protein
VGVITAIVVGAALVVGWLLGFLTRFVQLRAQWQAIKRDQAAIERDRAEIERGHSRDYWDAYEKRIAIREKVYERAVKGKDEKNRRKSLDALCDEYDGFLESWQQQQELARLAPQGALTADAPKRPEAETARIRILVDGSARLPAAVLDASDYFIRGNAYYEAGDYPQALEAYNRSLELRPDDPDTLNNRGSTLDELKRYEEALKDFNRALELRPDHTDTLYNRGNTLDDMGRYKNALKDYNRALELRPDQPATLNNRGITLRKLERYEDALKDFNRSLKLRPDHPGTLYNRACAYSLMGKFEEALDDLKAAVKGDEKWRGKARTDEDFEKLRKDPKYSPRFRDLVGEG